MLYANLFAQILIEIIVFVWLLETVAHEAVPNNLPRLKLNRTMCVILAELYLLNFERFMIFVDYPIELPWFWEAIYVIQLYAPIILVIVIGRLLIILNQLTVNRHDYENWKQSALHIVEIILITSVLVIEFNIGKDILNYIYI